MKKKFNITRINNPHINKEGERPFFLVRAEYLRI